MNEENILLTVEEEIEKKKIQKSWEYWQIKVTFPLYNFYYKLNIVHDLNHVFVAIPYSTSFCIFLLGKLFIIIMHTKYIPSIFYKGLFIWKIFIIFEL